MSSAARALRVAALAAVCISQTFGSALPVLAQAAPANVLTYQGRLLNANGVPDASATRNMQFRLFDSLAAGTCLWSNDDSSCASDADLSVALTDGLFSVDLGDTGAGFAAIPDSAFADDASVFLEVEVEGEVLSPRKRLTAAAYALNAQTLDGLDPADFALSADAFVDGGNSFGALATLGTDDAFGLAFETGGITRLTIDTSGNAVLAASAAFVANTTEYGDTFITQSIGSDFNINFDCGIGDQFQVEGAQFTVDCTTGDVGVGTDAPTADFDVALDTMVLGNSTASSSLSVEAVVLGATPLTFEGASVDGFETSFAITDPTGSDKTITFQNASGTVAFLSDVPSGSFTMTDGTTPQTLASGDTLTFADGTDIDVVTSATDTVTINDTSTLASVTGRGATTTTLLNLDGGIATDTSNFTVNGTTGAVSTTGTLSVSGTSTLSDDILFNAGTPRLTITNGETITVHDGTNVLFTLADAGSNGNFTATGDLAVNGGNVNFGAATTIGDGGDALTIDSNGTLTVSDATIAFTGSGTITSDTSNALTLDSGTTGAVNLGNGNGVKTVSIGNGTAANTINIGTENTAADVISIGSALDTTSLAGNGTSSIDFTNFDVATSGSITSAGDLALNGGDLTGSGALTITPASGSNLNVALATTGDFAINTDDFYVDTSSGFVGINTASPDARLNVDGAEDSEFVRFTDTTNADQVSLYAGLGSPNGALTAHAGSLFLDQGGAVYVNTDNGTTWVDLAAGGGGGDDLDTVYDADADKQMDVDDAAGLAFDLTTTGDLTIEDAGVAFATFNDSGNVILANDLSVDGNDLTGTAGSAFNLLANLTTGTLNIGTGLTSGDLNIATGTMTGDINVATGAGTQVVNLATGPSGKFVTLGSTSGGSETIIEGGTGDIKIGYASGSVDHLIGLGNGFGGGNIDLIAGTEGISMSASTTTGNALDLIASSLTTGTAARIASFANFSGSMISIDSNGATATAKAIDIDLDNGDANNDVFVLVTDETTISGTAVDTVKAHITASGEFFSDVGFTAGGASTRFRDGSISKADAGTLTIDTTSGALQLNTTNNQAVTFGTGVVTLGGDLAVNGDDLTSDGTLTIDSSGTVQLGTDDDLLPQLGAGDADLGSSGAAWDNVFVRNTDDGTNVSLSSDGSGETNAGASVIGAFDEFDNSASGNVQDVLDDFDTVISGLAAGSSKWSDAGAFTFLTSTTDNLVIGDSTVANASFFFEEATGQLDLGTDSSLAGTLRLYSATAATSDPTLAANASGNLVVTANVTSFSGDLAWPAATPTLSLANTETLLITDGTNTLLSLADGGTNGDLTIGSLTVGAIGLEDTASATTSGAFLVGAFDEFDNSASSTVQDVLDDFDTVISGLAAGSSKWTDSGSFTFLTSTTDDLVMGDSVVANASFFFDESAGQLDLGTDSTGASPLNGAIRFYSSGSVIDPILSANAVGDLGLSLGNPGDLFSVFEGNLSVGNGIPTLPLNSEDAYVEGTFEADGQAQFDGNVDATSGLDVTGASLTVGGANFSVTTAGLITTASDIAVNGGDVTSTGALNVTSAATNALTLDSGTTGAVNLGTGASAKAVTVGNNTGGTALTLTSGTGGIVATSTATSTNGFSMTAGSMTSGTAFVVNATALTFGRGLDVNTTANSPGGTTLTYGTNQINAAFAQGTTGVNYTGTGITLLQNTSIAGNTEYALTVALESNASASTDATVTGLMHLTNDDTGTGNQITVTNGIQIDGANVTNGINLSGTFGTNLITSTNFVVTQSGDLTMNGGNVNFGAATIVGDGGDQITLNSNGSVVIDDANLTFSGAGSLSSGGTNTAMQINSAGTGSVIIGGDSDAEQIQVGIGSGAKAVTIGSINTSSSTNIQSGTGGIDIGDGSATKTIDIGGVTSSATDTVNIATNSTLADVITIGNANTSTTLALTGGDDWSVSSAGLITTAGDLALNGGDLTSTAALTINGASTLTLGSDDDFLPGGGTTDNIGSSGARWDNIFAVNLDISGTTSFGDITCSNCLDFTEFADALTLDAATTVTLAANGLEFGATGAGNFEVNLSSTGVFRIEESGTASFVVQADGDTLVDSGNLYVGSDTVSAVHASFVPDGDDIFAEGDIAAQDNMYADSFVAGDASTTFGNGSVTSTSTLSITSGAASALTLDSGTTGTVNLATGSSAKTLNIATGTAANVVNLATDATAADTVTIGNGNVSTALALTGGDDWSMAATGVLTMSASAAATTAIVITDTDYTNALDIGDNNITGSSGDITLSAGDISTANGSMAATTLALTPNTASAGLDIDNLGITGDAIVQFALNTVNQFILGVDDSTTNDDFVIADGSALGTNNRLSIDGSTGNVTIGTDLAIGGGDLTSTGALTITPAAGNDLSVALSTTGDFVVNTNDLFVDTSAGFTGIGTATPGNTLHVFKGSSGTTGTTNAPLIVENSTSSFIHVIAPAANEQGILFGDPTDNISGGIVMSASGNDMGFRSGGNTTRMVLDASGNLGVGDATPDALLDVESATDAIVIVNASSGVHDAFVKFQTAGSTSFSVGLDDSNSAFMIAQSDTMGTNNRFLVAATGQVTINGSQCSACDLLVETATVTNAIRVDASEDTVNFGTASNVEGHMNFDFASKTVTAGAIGNGFNFTPRLTEAASSSHSVMSGVDIEGLVLTDGVATTNTAVTMRIVNAPTIGTNNYAFLVDNGDVRFDDELWVGMDSGSDDDIIYFDTVGAPEYFMWDESALRFEVSDDFNILGACTESGVACDLAESYFADASEGLAGYEVVAIDPTGDKKVKKTSVPYDPSVVGVVSIQPAILMEGSFVTVGNDTPGVNPTKPAIALAGVIRVNLSLENGTPAMGEYLTTSSMPGHAMRATQPGMAIGRVISGLTSTGPDTATVLIDVQVGWHDGGAFERGSSDIASASTPGVDSFGLSLRGSGWDGAAAQQVAMTLFTDVTDAGSYKLSIRNQADTEVAYVTEDGVLSASSDVVVGGRLYPSDRGTAQQSKYIFYDGADPDLDFMRTNAAGWATGSYDFAEMFPSASALEAGDVVAFDTASEHVKKAGADDRARLAGIVSTRPGFLAGENDGDDHPIALAGRVPTKVSVENGDIAVGDPLTVSATRPGYAMKATEPGQIVGYALENAAQDGTVITFVHLGHWTDGTAPAAGTSNAASGGTGSLTALNMSGNVYMQGNQILDVGAIAGLSGKWSIDGNGTMRTEGLVKNVIESFQGEAVETVAVTSPDVQVTLVGTATLQDGTATIAFEDVSPTFNDITSTSAPIRVLVTPNGPVSLYVEAKDHNGFTVRQVGGADSGIAFDWMVSAFRKDFEPPVTAPPAEAPPAEEAPAEEPVPEEPAVEEPPAEEPPAEVPPQESPEIPPADEPTVTTETPSEPTP